MQQHEATRFEPTLAGAGRRQAAEENVPLEWQVGDTILDLYEVKDVYTSGGMGLVYRVHHRGWNLDLAVKCPRPQYFSTEAHKADFVREAETWVDLGLHPHIVTCHYVRALGGIPRVFAEFVEGGSLKDWVRDRRLYTGGQDRALERILDVAIQFAWGLAYAHEQGLVHQDVKPANVLMMPDGTAKVTDFGLARARAAAGERADAGSGQSILVSSGGYTPAYCSPEQARGEPVSRTTDVWSWAVSVLEMFTGEVTWLSGQVAAEALELYLEAGAPDPQIPPMPAGLPDLLHRALDPTPAARPANLDEVAGELLALYQGLIAPTYPRERPQAVALRAGALNNRALSLLDLGRGTEATEVWGQALQADPHHAEATYNLGLWRWKQEQQTTILPGQGQQTDIDLVTQVETVARNQPGAWLPHYLLAQVHIQRRDLEGARASLDEAAKLAPGAVEVERAYRLLREVDPTTCIRTLTGHSGAVSAVAILPDGHHAISGGSDGTLRLWSLSDGTCIATLQAHAADVRAVAVTPHGRLALAAVGCTIEVWDLATRDKLHTLEAEASDVTALAVTPDGHATVAGDRGGSLRIWELEGGGCLGTLGGPTGWTAEQLQSELRLVTECAEVRAVAVTPDGSRIVSACESSRMSRMQIWDLKSRTLLETQQWIHPSDWRDIALLPDGRFLLASSRGLEVWDLVGEKRVRTLRAHRGHLRSVAAAANGRWAVSSGEDETLRLWDLMNRVCLRTVTGRSAAAGPAAGVCALAVSPNGRLIVSGAEDSTLRVWQVVWEPPAPLWAISRPAPSRELQIAETGARRQLQVARLALESGQAAAAALALQQAFRFPGFERDPALLDLWHAAGCRGGRATGLRLVPRCLEVMKRHVDPVHAIAVTPDGQRAVSADEKYVWVWDLPGWLEQHTLRSWRSSSVNAVAVTPDGRCALVARGPAVEVYDLATGELLRDLEGSAGPVMAVAPTPDGQSAASATSDGTVSFWDLHRGACTQKYRTSLEGVKRLAITPDGRHAVASASDGTVTAWNLATGMGWSRQLGGLLAITPDGRWAISQGRDLLVWELSGGTVIRSLQGHTDLATAATVSPDGRWAVSGSDDNTLRLWDLTTGECLFVLEGHQRPVKAVAFTPDGRYLLSSGVEPAIRRWILDWDYEFPEAADWDEGARPYLEIFLALHPAPKPKRFRRPAPAWSEEDVQRLLAELGRRGYGWLRPEGVRHRLEEMAQARE